MFTYTTHYTHRTASDK